jgi:F420-non-reducing hydrogenase small subunit
MKIATIALSSCSGCHMALLALGKDLLKLIDGHELAYSPILMDEKQPIECDIALVEGSVRNNENVEYLKELRQKAKALIALGTCSTFGGIPGLGSAFSTIDLLMKSYGKDYVPQDNTVLEQRVSPIDQWVQVDYYLPGCPPPLDILRDALTKLLTGKKPNHVGRPVCGECHRKARKRVQPEFKRIADEIPEQEECLLSQGYVCLGSVTRNGCKAVCTQAGVPCMGCRGPIDRVFVEPTHGVFYDLVRRISHFTGRSEKQIVANLPDTLHNLYAFTLSVPEMRRKDSERLDQIIHRIDL